MIGIDPFVTTNTSREIIDMASERLVALSSTSLSSSSSSSDSLVPPLRILARYVQIPSKATELASTTAAIAAFEISSLLPLSTPDLSIEAIAGAEEVWKRLTENVKADDGEAADAVLDDRQLNLAWKMNDADLVGYPVIVIVGKYWATDKE